MEEEEVQQIRWESLMGPSEERGRTAAVVHVQEGILSLHCVEYTVRGMAGEPARRKVMFSLSSILVPCGTPLAISAG